AGVAQQAPRTRLRSPHPRSQSPADSGLAFVGSPDPGRHAGERNAMNQMTTAPASFTPASCPLLAAVLPVRYAIGPLKSTASVVSATSLQLPEINGAFPDLGPDYPQLNECSLGYVPRMLRDGWLYVWQETLGQLSE